MGNLNLQQIVCHIAIATLGIFIGYMSSTIHWLQNPLKLSSIKQSKLDNPDIAIAIGSRGLQLFHQHDRNDDGLLTLEEFVPIARRFFNEYTSENKVVCI